ncbi:MAG: sugar phosphate isomerase/epimerase family protein [Candidatus Helarchaeota archaeon]
MKFSIVSGLNESSSSNSRIIETFTGLCELLQPLGYKGIELAILEPEKIPVGELKNIADSYQMDIPTVGTGATYLRFGYSLGHKLANIRQKAIERLRKYIEFATFFNSKVVIGLIRGRRTYDLSPEQERDNIVISLKRCCEIAEDHDIELVFEPINRFEIDTYNTIAESLELIKEINSSHLKLLIDSFHTHLEENPNTVWDYLESIADYVSHLHLADDTRRAPGTGHFDFKRFLTIFESHNFQGFASVETIMHPSFEIVARETINYMKSINMLK